MKLIYKPWGSDPSENKRGLPAGYPRESTKIENKDPIPEGWIEISNADYRNLVELYRAEVAGINALIDSSAKDSDTQKLDAVKRLFDDGKAIFDVFETATNAQKFELCRITFELLLKQRRQILDQYRPE